MLSLRILATTFAFILFAQVTSGGPFLPSPLRPNAELPFAARHVAESMSCGMSGCHPDIAKQWSSSAHHFSSFNNPFYKAAVERFMSEADGMAKARWCAGCHDPALLLTENFVEGLDSQSTLARAGVGCLICHAAQEPIDLRGNGGYAIDRLEPVPNATAGNELLRKLGRQWLRMRPAKHKKMLLRPLHERAEFCMSCHKVSVPPEVNDYRWKRGQNEYDAWHYSGVAGNNAQSFHFRRNPATCITCHMPEVESDDRGADEGRVASHRFAAANSALPALNGDEAQLQAVRENLQRGTMRLWLGGVSVNGGPIVAPDGLSYSLGDELSFYVVVRNLNVGHRYPGGTIDSHESWLDVTVLDADGRLLLHSGALDGNGSVEPNARVYRTRMLDAEGDLLFRRDVQHWVATGYTLTVGPGLSDVARYRIRVDSSMRLPLKVEARLRYRKFHPTFTTWVYATEGMEPVEIPIVDVAHGSWEPGAMEALDAATEADRWNDLGVALYVQRDRTRALDAFARAAALAPDRADLQLNQARIAWADGDLASADLHLTAAAQLDPTHPTLLLLEARVLASRGEQAEAIEHYEQLLAVLPLDRGAILELANVRYNQGDHEGALRAFDRVLDIDPESLAAHSGRLRTLRALGRPIDAALEAVERYKPAEVEKSIAGDWLRENDAEHRAAQAVWEARQP